MGNEYYGRNDYRDYLAHYGVKGMKWKKKKRALTPEEIRAIRRNRLRERMASNENANARMEARANRDARRARAAENARLSGLSVDSFNGNKDITVTSSRRVQANPVSLAPQERTKRGKNVIKRLKTKNLSAKAFTAKTNTSKVNSIMSVMGGPALRVPASRR